jgi:hypothetical protein
MNRGEISCVIMVRNELCRVGSGGGYFEHRTVSHVFVWKDISWQKITVGLLRQNHRHDISHNLHLLSTLLASRIALTARAARTKSRGSIPFTENRLLSSPKRPDWFRMILILIFDG